MKKFRYLSTLLSLLLVLQWFALPASATQIAEGADAAVTEPAVIPFGQVCVQKGCRTIEGMVPLGGSDWMLDTAQSAFLYEVNTDTVVYSYNPDMKVHPGSLAKIVIAMIVLEECELDETVVAMEGIQSLVPASAHKLEPVYIKSLEEFTVEDLLHAMLLTNANDAAVALAQHVATTTSAFLELMNNRVKQLGCSNTEFGNISGLFTAVSTSTARDITKIVRAAIKNEDFVKIFGTASYDIQPTNMVETVRQLKTHNYMIDEYTIPDFIDGRVTGGFPTYHEDTGASIVCTAEYRGLKYIAVVLGATRTFAENGWQPVNYGNFNELTKLLSFGFDNYKTNRIIYNGMSLSQFSVAGGECNAVGEARVDIDSVVPINAQMDNLIMQFDTGGELSAPVSEGDQIATMQISYRNSVLAEAEVYSVGNVKPITDTGVTIRSTAVRSDSDDSGFLSVLGAICVVVLLLAAAYLGFNAYMRSRMRARRRRRRQNRRRNY